MKKKALILFIVAIIVVIMCGIFLHSNKSAIKSISGSELTKIVDTGQNLIVVFYSEDCITCRKLEKDIQNTKSKEIKNLLNDVYWVNVDKPENTDIVEKYDIKGVPTAVHIKNTKIEKTLSGNLNYIKLMDYINKR